MPDPHDLDDDLFALYDEWAYSHYSNRFLMSTVALASVFAGLPVFALWESWRRRPREDHRKR